MKCIRLSLLLYTQQQNHLHFPYNFKIYIRKALEEWKRKCYGMGIPLENITLYTLQFANDQVVLAGDTKSWSI
jgi:hypothetical protein